MKQLRGLMIIAIAYLIAEVAYSASVKPGDLITQATLFRLARAMSTRPNGTGSDPTFS
jgi:hypothetical protein